MSARNVASPLSTGGAGTFFEQHVATYWLTQLLVRAIPPVLIDSNVVEVSFQTEHLGWHTDDFLITCEASGATRRKLVGQVKRSFTVSAADEGCKKAIIDFWKDYRSADRFSPDRDRLVLVVQRGTEVLLGHFGGLLDHARAARDAADFQHRLSTSGLISKPARRYCEELSEILAEHEGRAIGATDLWPFLRVLYLLSLDLDTSTRQTEAHMKALLAYAAGNRGSAHLAESSWNSLLAIVSSAMTQARTLRREDLPDTLRSLHAALGTDEERMLQALREHTAPILRRIRSTIGANLHLARVTLVQAVLDELETAQVVVVSGPAGSGKSAVGKNVIARCAPDHFVFAFRVEEFAQPHIDATLHTAQIPGNAERLAAVLGAQTRKLVLIESVERLLEKSTRDAFSDLMAQAAADPDMRLVLTCRDYSTEQVRASFLRPSGLSHSVLTVPSLDDAELAEVANAIPALAEPLRNERLKNILRNPYFLDKALEMEWPAGRPLPESEREFRALFWRQVVRVDRGAALDMGLRREGALQQIAVRRARALSEYIPISDLDLQAVGSLRQDSLIESPADNPSLVATAHDVLEDWAILQWLEKLHLTDSLSLPELSAGIGGHPAIRRSYRKWVAELLEREPSAADRLFAAATAHSGASMQFRDDTLVSLLGAPLAPQLLERHQTQIYANDNAILKRVIHLLRVACVTTPDWLRGGTEHGSVFNVPEGPAWATVVGLAYRRLTRFTDADRPLLIGLVEDAVRGVSWWAPDVEGAEFIAGIAHTLLPKFDSHRGEDPRSRLLKVIAKIPKADPARFESVLRGVTDDEERRERRAEEFQNLLFTGIEGMPAVRDLPELMVSVAADYLLASEEAVRAGSYRRYSIDVDIHFGIKGGLRHDFFPSSAQRGPWIPLLRRHPQIGLELYFKIFNQSIDWYVNPRVPNPLEEAWEIELKFADGSVCKQWCNSRLWNSYRGTSVSPYALQSMLMALETWLFEVARAYPDQLDAMLLTILRRSQSACLSAVVASVATAHPHEAGEALLVLLSAADYVRLDRERMGGESQASALARMSALHDPEKRLYRDEREKANALPHRGRDLEWAIANLQLGPLGQRVYELLDRHLAALPESSRPDKSDVVWLLALRRMDLRQYAVSDVPDAQTENASAPSAATESTFVRIEPRALDADAQALVDESASSLNAMNELLGPWMWGIKAFRREIGEEERGLWREKLIKARSIDRETEDQIGGRNGPGVVAAVCIRDHWTDLSNDERSWCAEVACSEVLRHADRWNQIERIQRHDMAADRLCASVMPLLLTKITAEPALSKARHALAVAITHPVDEVRWFAAWGVTDEVWRLNREAALRCIYAIAFEAERIEELWEKAQRRPWKPEKVDALFSDVTKEVRRRFWKRDGIRDDAHTKLNLAGRAAADANARILTIFSSVPHDHQSVAAFERASRALVDEWDESDRGAARGRDRNFESEHAVAERLQRFVMQTTPEHASRVLGPVLDAVDRHTRELQSFIQGLIGREDSHPNTPQYWYVWQLFADRVKRARWVAWLDRRHATGGEVLAAIFMTCFWKEDVRHWKSLEGNAHRVDELLEALPRAQIVLDSYLRFLYHIGERSLPHAFRLVASALQQGKALEMLGNSNTVFLLEVLLQRHVYGRPLELKQNASIRDAVFFLLDILVEAGSSAGFRMRDDFVTPVV